MCCAALSKRAARRRRTFYESCSLFATGGKSCLKRESTQSSFTLSEADDVVGRPRGDLKEARHGSQVAQLQRARTGRQLKGNNSEERTNQGEERRGDGSSRRERAEAQSSGGADVAVQSRSAGRRTDCLKDSEATRTTNKEQVTYSVRPLTARPAAFPKTAAGLSLVRRMKILKKQRRHRLFSSRVPLLP